MNTLTSEIQSSNKMSVKFQIEDDKLIDQQQQQSSNQGLTRKKASEPFLVHEIRPWSSLINTYVRKDNNHHIQSYDPSISSINQEDLIQHSSSSSSSNRSRSILIDRTKSSETYSEKLTYHCLLGTMPIIHSILTNKHFLSHHRYFKTLILFIDSCLRGIGQVMFANNPLSGSIIIIGLLIGRYPMGLSGLFGTILSTLTAHFLGVNSQPILSGLYGYNGCLTAMFIYSVSFELTLSQMIGSIILMSILSTIIFISLCQIFVHRFDLSPLTFSFQLCSLIWLLCALKLNYLSLDGIYLQTNLISSINDNTTNQTNIFSPMIEIISGVFINISEVYFIHNMFVGIIILFGISICSPRLALLALFGSITSQLFSIYLFDINQDLRNSNSVLTCQVLGGMFFVLNGYHIWLYTLFGSLMTLIVQISLSRLLSSSGIPSLMFSSIFICWLFCLIAGSSRYLIGVRLRSMSIPEDHLRRYRLSSLVKMHFKFVNDLSTILEKVGGNENIPDEDLITIEREFVPILLCSYTHQNDLINLKSLLAEGADVNSTDYDLRSSLHLASSNGNLQICQFLIEDYRANVNLIDDFGGSPLYDAYCHGNFHLIPYLYSKGARIPEGKLSECTFLFCAFAFEGHLEGIQYLIACGINPNSTDNNGRTPLHLAVCSNHYSLVKYLVEEINVSLSIKDYFGRIPLDDALKLVDQRIASYLQYWMNDLSNEKIRVVDIFIDNRYHDDILDEHDNEQFIIRSSTTLEESLLPVLFCTAAGEGNVQQMINILKQFPKFRADNVDYDYRSAAHVAAAEGQLISIQFLSKHFSSKKQNLHWIYREDRWGYTPIEEAYRYGHDQLANYLQEHQIKYSSLISSSSINSNSLISTKPFIQSIQKWKKIRHFNQLASNNEAQLIKGLLTSGVFSPSKVYADYDGRTPMHWATINGHFNVVQVLQQCGDNGKIHRDRWGNSALDEARRKKFIQIINILLDDIV